MSIEDLREKKSNVETMRKAIEIQKNFKVSGWHVDLDNVIDVLC